MEPRYYPGASYPAIVFPSRNVASQDSRQSSGRTAEDREVADGYLSARYGSSFEAVRPARSSSCFGRYSVAGHRPDPYTLESLRQASDQWNYGLPFEPYGCFGFAMHPSMVHSQFWPGAGASSCFGHSNCLAQVDPTPVANTASSQPEFAGTPIPSVDPNKVQVFKKKRPRVAISELAKNTLEASFKSRNFVSKQEKTRLSSLLGLSEKQVKVWFQNRRVKQRHKNEAERLENRVDQRFARRVKTHSGQVLQRPLAAGSGEQGCDSSTPLRSGHVPVASCNSQQVPVHNAPVFAQETSFTPDADRPLALPDSVESP